MIGFIQPKKPCRYCHASIPESATFCTQCGRFLAFPHKPICTECGKLAEERSDLYCSACGTSLTRPVLVKNGTVRSSSVSTSSRVSVRLVLRKVRLVSWEVPHGCDKQNNK